MNNCPNSTLQTKIAHFSSWKSKIAFFTHFLPLVTHFAPSYDIPLRIHRAWCYSLGTTLSPFVLSLSHWGWFRSVRSRSYALVGGDIGVETFRDAIAISFRKFTPPHLGNGSLLILTRAFAPGVFWSLYVAFSITLFLFALWAFSPSDSSGVSIPHCPFPNNILRAHSSNIYLFIRQADIWAPAWGFFFFLVTRSPILPYSMFHVSPYAGMVPTVVSFVGRVSPSSCFGYLQCCGDKFWWRVLLGGVSDLYNTHLAILPYGPYLPLSLAQLSTSSLRCHPLRPYVQLSQ